MRSLSIIVAITVLFFACQEYRDVTPSVPEGERVVLLEEFTGKGCTNCPKGSRELENLLSFYDSNLAVVSIHAGFFANPQFFDLGKYDLRTPEGEKLFSYLGPNVGYPAGVVDRVRVDGSFQHGSNRWADLIENELDVDPPVEFTIEQVFNSEERSLTVEINGRAKEDLSGPLHISVMLTESGIVDAQDDFEQGGIVEDYVHKHVLRTMPTAYNGDLFASSLTLGETFSATYTIQFDESWVTGNCKIIAFVSRVQSDTNFRVLQAGKADVIN